MGAWWLTFQSMDVAALGRSIERLPSRLRPLADFFSLWTRFWRLEQRPTLYRAVLAAMLLLGLFAAIYSGIFLMNEHGVPVWNSPAQMLIFFFIAVAKGAVVLMLFVPLLKRMATGQRIPIDPSLRPVAAASVTLTMVVWAGWLWWLGRFGTVAELRAANLFMGPYAQAILWNWWIVGFLLPITVLMSPLGRNKVFYYLAAAGILWGSYAVRYFIMIGGQALNRSGASYLAFQPNDHVLWYTGFSALFMVGLLALLLSILSLERPANPDRSVKGAPAMSAKGSAYHG